MENFSDVLTSYPYPKGSELVMIRNNFLFVSIKTLTWKADK